MHRMPKYLPWSLALCAVTATLSAAVPFKVANAQPNEANCWSTASTDHSTANGLCLTNHPTLIAQTMDAEYYLEQGRKLAINENTRQAAIIEITKAIELKPDYIEAYCYRINIFGLLDQPEAAIADAQKAAELFETQGEAAKAKVMRDLADDLREGIKAGDFN